jgi:polyhydroxyalkanoate synthesis repressor PhaR
MAEPAENAPPGSPDPAGSGKAPITIKKYANRRLYNTGSSAYVTLEDLATMVKDGEDFVVFDAKSGEDITRSVLAQIIFEQEGKSGQNLLPTAFLRQLIRFYGDSMQMLVPSFLEMSISKFVDEQQKYREQVAKTFGAQLPGAEFQHQFMRSIEEQTRSNLALFSQTLSVFNPFAAKTAANTAADTPAGHEAPAAESGEQDLDGVRRELREMRKRIEELARKP